ncbi:High cysteine membrane protein Group 4 [Giardia lamblia P15]|uniref:High cysteine membrane protein Group 4 n=1 Tax=Giardia intestinalis (strain P15) TaxID=658858 RepID=E1EW38_GIAIA|nr:High cysteine membrane protein Group 4 [Giardia lamblia P15]
MLATLLLLFLVSSYGASTDTYHNNFGVACDNAQENCMQNRCVVIESTSVCTQCIPGYVPISGTCTEYPGSASSICIPDSTTSPTRCVECKDSASEASMFLFYGGCYDMIDESIGSSVCSKASSGKCTECNVGVGGRYVFTNPDGSTAEGCILCSDRVGFGGYRGVAGCLECIQPVDQRLGTPLCFECDSTTLAPIDYQCQDKGHHICSDGRCTSCYKTHLFYNGGCYGRHTTTGLAICAGPNQYELDNTTICTECANASYAPKNGACTLVKKDSTTGGLFLDCAKDPARGLCTACSSSTPSFLFYGGCYDTSSYVGSILCSRIGSNACEEWNGQYPFIFPEDTAKRDHYLCGDAANGGVASCATCSYASSAVICTSCSAGYLGVDGKSCNESCSGNTQGACIEILGGSESTILLCQCICKLGFYNNSGICMPCTDSCAACKDGTPNGCQQCSPGKVLESSVITSGNAKCIDECTTHGSCVECGLTIDGSKYCTRCKDPSMYPLNGVCTTDAQRTSYCTTKANGICSACSEAAFLMNGGCYTTVHYPGDIICISQADGKCTATREGYGISADGKLQPCAPECLECTAPGLGRCTKCPPGRLLRRASAAATGSCIEPGACADGYYADGDACLPCVVPGCRACGRTSFCTECAGELFVGLDGRACLRECSGDRVVGEVSGGTRRCWCERGFVLALDRSGCVPTAECPPGVPWCASCDESGRCLSCAAPGHNIQVDQRTCAEGCGDRAAPDQGVCVCETGTVLDKDACVPINALTGRKMMVVTTSAAAAVLVIGVLAGFLCWWFICRGKRRCYR